MSNEHFEHKYSSFKKLYKPILHAQEYKLVSVFVSKSNDFHV